MSLSDKINEDIKECMKSKDSFKLGVIRMVKGAIQLEKINKKDELSDEEVAVIISKQIKMRKDSIEGFKLGNREDLISEAEKEIGILNTYMPEQLSIEEVNKIIDEAIEKVKPTSAKEMGLIMKEVSPHVKGKADMGEVSKIIREKLANM